MCTSIAAGREATLAGDLIIARNEDCARANWNKAMIRRVHPEYCAPQRTGVSGDTWTLGNGMTVPLPSRAFAYTGMPDAEAASEATGPIGNRFFFEERGINTANFAISATNSLEDGRPEIATIDPFVAHGLAESILPTLLLSQCESAEHALEHVALYMAGQGASEPNGFFLADPSEIWYVEIGSGHHWLAVRVPDDRYIAVANGFRICGVNLEDRANVRCSDGLFAFVKTHGLLEHPDRRDFDFAAAFGTLGDPRNTDRVWLAQRHLTPSAKQATGQKRYPLFMTPDRKIAQTDVFAVLRATYEDTPLECVATADRPIGWPKTAESHVISLDRTLPPPLCGLIWQAVSTPLCAPYVPLYACMDEVPPAYHRGDDRFGMSSAYWSFRSVYDLARAEGARSLICTLRRWQSFEDDMIRRQHVMRQMLCAPGSEDLDLVPAFAGRFSHDLAREAVVMADAIRRDLMTRLAG